MRLLADESVDAMVVETVRTEGHDTVYVAEISPSIQDDEVLSDADRRQALLITADKDFGELVYRQHRIHAGVILLRLSGLPPPTKANLVTDGPARRSRLLSALPRSIAP